MSVVLVWVGVTGAALCSGYGAGESALSPAGPPTRRAAWHAMAASSKQTAATCRVL